MGLLGKLSGSPIDSLRLTIDLFRSSECRPRGLEPYCADASWFLFIVTGQWIPISVISGSPHQSLSVAVTSICHQLLSPVNVIGCCHQSPSSVTVISRHHQLPSSVSIISNCHQSPSPVTVISRHHQSPSSVAVTSRRHQSSSGVLKL